MRTIKFRVWDDLSKKYVQDNSLYVLGVLVNGVLTFSADDDGELLSHHKIEQSTGLYDIYGNEIWEGDIASEDCNEYVVKWDEEDGMWTLSDDNITLHFNNVSSKWFEVIGNIHE